MFSEDVKRHLLKTAVDETGGKLSMKKAILARKVGMTQIFNEEGALIPVRSHSGENSRKRRLQRSTGRL